MALLALWLAQKKETLSPQSRAALVDELLVLPAKLQTVLALDGECERLARKLYRATNALYLGRGLHFPVALEGALKLKEISYIHAEGYPAGEMKHGPNALIDDSLPVFVLAARSSGCERSRLRYDKTISNIQEVKARSGIVVAIGCEADRAELEKLSDHVLSIPGTHEILQPILAILPLQLFAYHAAVLRGCDVDQPRNLAKSVTVE
jgi:glucosamine--fructose-6-phosphate aminotransferase (isomerizing)